MGRDMLNKSLIQFSVDGQGCVPSLLFDLRPNYGGGNEDNGELLQKVLCIHRHTQCPIFSPFHAVHGILKERILKWFSIPFSVDHILLEFSTMTHLSWVALHGMAHSFIELDKGL